MGRFVGILCAPRLGRTGAHSVDKKLMKTTALMLAIIGLAANLTVPAFAMTPKGSDLTVYQESECDEGQVWDDEQQKCVPESE